MTGTCLFAVRGRREAASAVAAVLGGGVGGGRVCVQRRRSLACASRLRRRLAGRASDGALHPLVAGALPAARVPHQRRICPLVQYVITYISLN